MSFGLKDNITNPNQITEADSREALIIFREISDLLNAGLDETSINLCYQLLLSGVSPEALALAVKEIRRRKEEAQVSPQ